MIAFYVKNMVSITPAMNQLVVYSNQVKLTNVGFHTVRYGTVEPVTAAVWYRGKISRDIQ